MTLNQQQYLGGRSLLFKAGENDVNNDKPGRGRIEAPGMIGRLDQGDEVAIIDGNRVVARIVGERIAPYQRPGPGLCKGMITIEAEDDEHLQDFAEYMPQALRRWQTRIRPYEYRDDPQTSVSSSARWILDPQNDVLMSPASYWEIAIKVSIGKLKLHQPYDDFIDACLQKYKFRILPIEPAHTARLLSLPFPPNHKDPFDRLLVAQALVEQMSMVSSDKQLDAYPITRLW